MADSQSTKPLRPFASTKTTSEPDIDAAKVAFETACVTMNDQLWAGPGSDSLKQQMQNQLEQVNNRYAQLFYESLAQQKAAGM